MSLTISEKDARILHAAELSADISVAALAKKTGYKPHVVRYSLQQLERAGIIGKPQPLINMYRLGFVEYVLLLDIGSADPLAKEGLISWLLHSPHVGLVIEIGGAYELFVIVCVDNTQDFFSVMEHVGQFSGGLIVKKSISIRTSFSVFRRDYLSSKQSTPSELRYGTPTKILNKNDFDLDLLSKISSTSHNSLRELSQATGKPITTIERHKKKLEEEKVIEGYMYRVNAVQLGKEMFRIVVNLKGATDVVHERFYEWAKNTPSIVFLDARIGDWDYMLGVELDKARELLQIREDMFRHFGNYVGEVDSWIVYRFSKINYNFNYSH